MVLSVPVEQISTQARQADPVRVLLTLIAVIPFIVGWSAGKAWLALAWLCTAVRVGWQQARQERPGEGEGG